MKKLIEMLGVLFLLIFVSLILLGHSKIGNLENDKAKNGTFINIERNDDAEN